MSKNLGVEAIEETGTITFRAFSPNQRPVKISALEDRTGKLRTKQGERGYYENLTEEEKKTLPIVINYDTRVTITDGKVMDLSDPIDKALWEIVKLHPYIALDKDGRNREHAFYVENPKLQAERYVSKDKKVTLAKSKVYAASSDKKSKVAKALGLIGAEGTDGNVIEQWLIIQCETMPDTVDKLFASKNDKLINAMSMFQELTKYQIVKRHGAVYKFNGSDGTVLGKSDEEVVDYIMDVKNEETVHVIVNALNERKGKSE